MVMVKVHTFSNGSITYAVARIVMPNGHYIEVRACPCWREGQPDTIRYMVAGWSEGNVQAFGESPEAALRKWATEAKPCRRLFRAWREDAQHVLREMIDARIALRAAEKEHNALSL